MLEYWLEILRGIKGKELITLLGIGATFFVSYKNYRNSKNSNDKNLYINSITKERVESMGEMKENIASYFALVSKFRIIEFEEMDKKGDFLKDLEYRTLKIAFQLNPDNLNEEKLYNEFNKINALIEYNLFYLEDEKEEIYPVKLLNIIDKYKVTVADFYNDYEKDKNLVSKIELHKRVLIQFKKNHINLLEKIKEKLTEKLREHLQVEWNKAKSENKLY
ncbi:hypothetical protein CN324_05265 [Bacillus anthracis]|uniref:hypothetical protein n=1 Tax=Bacillus tropicus TaxID=2026188 RepID=UPI00003CB420|nr:hypothetical protein [Bacillus tropicus]AIY77747.1 hypothetical protein NT98_4659 [Bacillus cereus]AJI05030.1 hypothetical protein AQ16_1607 [Bacillus cereus G9241]PFF22492.1 hypothetical protein CN324_05265 [Bacillus anthracis]ARO16838.1 hypothetical protein B2J90_04730 [Bacillus cereus]EAL16510.1 hypothetical protein protein [Bacillus cereus G9241]